MKFLLLLLLLLSATISASAQSGNTSQQVYHVMSETRLNKESKNWKSALRQTSGVSPEKLPLYDRIVDQYIKSMSGAKTKQDEKDAFILMQKRFDFPMHVYQAFMKQYVTESFMGIGK